MEAYLCRGRFIVNLEYDWLVMMSIGGRGRFIVNLEYDWLVMMSIGGAVVSFYHVTSWYKI